jgi:hypothetical protein
MAIGSQTGIINDFSDALKKLTGILQWFSNAPKPFYDLARAIMYLGGVMAAAKITQLLMLWTGFIPRLGGLATLGKAGGLVGAKQVSLSAFPAIGRSEAATVAMFGPALIAGSRRANLFKDFWVQSGIQGAIKNQVLPQVKDWMSLGGITETMPEFQAALKLETQAFLANKDIMNSLTARLEAEADILAGTMSPTKAFGTALKSLSSVITLTAASLMNLPPFFGTLKQLGIAPRGAVQVKAAGAAPSMLSKEMLATLGFATVMPAVPFNVSGLQADWKKLTTTISGTAQLLTRRPTTAGGYIAGAGIAGVAAYGITKDKWAAIGSAIAGGIGSAFGPLVLL